MRAFTKISALGIVFVLLSGLSASWVLAAESAVSEIEAEAARLEELDKMLRSDSKYVRRSAIEKAFESDSPVVYEMALHAAFDSDDKSLQTRAVREFLTVNENINVEIELPNDPSEAQETYYQDITPAWWRVTVKENGEICAQHQGGGVDCDYKGSFTPGGFVINSRYHKLVLQVANETTLRGHIENRDNVTLPAVLEIQ